ncbi:hypothetical protein ACVWZ3_006315 [Bradyrhizobium sp. i1.3.6]
MLLIELPQLTSVLLDEPLGGRPKRVREARRHGGVGKIGRLPEFDLGGRHVDPQVFTQPLLHPVDEQSANVIHVQVGQHQIGHGRKIDAGGLQSLDQLAGARQVQIRVGPQSSVDEDGLVAAADHDRIQRPVESVLRQEHVVQPGRPDGRVGIVRQHRGWQRQHAVADHQHVDLADLQRVARWNELFRLRCRGV